MFLSRSELVTPKRTNRSERTRPCHHGGLMFPAAKILSWVRNYQMAAKLQASSLSSLLLSGSPHCALGDGHGPLMACSARGRLFSGARSCCSSLQDPAVIIHPHVLRIARWESFILCIGSRARLGTLRGYWKRLRHSLSMSGALPCELHGAIPRFRCIGSSHEGPPGPSGSRW